MAAANDPLDNSLTEMDWLGQLNIKTGSLVDVKSLRQVPPSNVGQHKATASTVVPSSCVSSADVICDDLLSAISQRLHGRAGIAESDDVITRTQLMRTDKPAHSYTYLITCAISSTPTRKMALHDIYQWISDSYPYYKTAAPGWKNSVRHNLSLNKCFMKVARNKDDPGKGSYWALVDENQLKSRQKDVFSPGVGPNAVARLRLQQNVQGCGSDAAYCDRQYIVDGFSLTSVGDHLHRIPFGLHNGEVINDVSSSASFSGQSESFGGSWTNLPLVTATNVDELLAVSVPDGHQIEPNAVYVAHSICPQQPELLRSGLLANHLDHSCESSSSLTCGSSQGSSYEIERTPIIDITQSNQQQILVNGTYQLLENVEWEIYNNDCIDQALMDSVDDDFDWDRLL